jgi:dGTPase
MARALGLNEDLTEALCLAHDLGHPPFGHAGEDALQAAMASAGGFDHNAHSIRLVTKLETPYPDFDGLNLSWEALEGLAKHNGPIAAPTWALAEANSSFDLELDSWPSLEAQVAAVSDDIAYDNHDIDDGLRAGLITFEDLLEVPIVGRHWRDIWRRHPGISEEKALRALVRDMIGTMVADVLTETERRLVDARAGTVDDVRDAGRQLSGFSAALAVEERELKQFLYGKLYNAPALVPV